MIPSDPVRLRSMTAGNLTQEAAERNSRLQRQGPTWLTLPASMSESQSLSATPLAVLV
jgi:hypothetical protein